MDYDNTLESIERENLAAAQREGERENDEEVTPREESAEEHDSKPSDGDEVVDANEANRLADNHND